MLNPELKNGISYSIFEKDDESSYTDRPRGWTIALHWGTEYISNCLPQTVVECLPEAKKNLTDEVLAEQEVPLAVYNGKTGKWLPQSKDPVQGVLFEETQATFQHRDELRSRAREQVVRIIRIHLHSSLNT
jgi:hypothetical protein